jgi:hypothetical protein
LSDSNAFSVNIFNWDTENCLCQVPSLLVNVGIEPAIPVGIFDIDGF